MNISLIKSAIRLTAITAAISKREQHVEPHLRNYLANTIPVADIEQFISIYYFQIKGFNARESEIGPKRASALSVKGVLICDEFNNELSARDKAMILLLQLDIILTHPVEPFEMDYIRALADALYICDADFEHMYEFAASTVFNRPDNPDFLYIDAETETLTDYARHIYRRNFPGQAIIYYCRFGGFYILRLLGLTDNLMLNGRSLSENLMVPFDKGGVLRNLKILPVYYSEVLSAFFRERISHPVSLQVDGAGYNFPDGSAGISPFSLTEHSGNMVAIMGSSGVGKTTMLNLLSGIVVPTSGKVLINGNSLHQQYSSIKGHIGYVPQDDLLVEELTVFENLFYSTKLCFRGISEDEIWQKTDNILHELGLYETRNLQVGSPVNKLISGGQRKRLNIALELIREPSLLLVDEPTSGLSSSDSENVILLLKRQALRGRMVFVNIHQPSSDIFKQFDKLMVLDKGGRMIYYGNPSESVMYFKSAINKVDADLPECLCCGNINPEQILQIIEEKKVDNKGYATNQRKILPEKWQATFLKSPLALPVTPEPCRPLHENPFKPLPSYGQFKVFSLRNLLIKLRDKQYLAISLAEAPLLAFILAFFSKYYAGSRANPNAYVFYENENLPAYLFMSVVVALFIGLMGSAEQIIRDVRILKRERFLQLSWPAYIHSKIVFLFILTGIQIAVYVAVGHIFVGIRGTLFSHWIVLFTAACFAIMLGLNISSGLKSIVAIYILIPLLLVPQLLLSGSIIKFDKLNNKVTSSKYVPVAGDLMASRWAYEALLVGQYRRNAYDRYFYPTDRDESEASYNLNYLIPELEMVIAETQANLATLTDTIQISRNLSLLQSELVNLSYQAYAPANPGLITRNGLEPSNLEDARTYLAELRGFFLDQLNHAIRRRDAIVDSLSLAGGRKYVVLLKEQHSNESLSKLVTNATEKNKLQRMPRWIVRRYEPIFYHPSNQWGRAHFYSPAKRIGAWLIDTLWFNCIVLWLMSIVLYITLRYEVLRRVVDRMGRFSLFDRHRG